MPLSLEVEDVVEISCLSLNLKAVLLIKTSGTYFQVLKSWKIGTSTVQNIHINSLIFSPEAFIANTFLFMILSFDSVTLGQASKWELNHIRPYFIARSFLYRYKKSLVVSKSHVSNSNTGEKSDRLSVNGHGRSMHLEQPHNNEQTLPGHLLGCCRTFPSPLSLSVFPYLFSALLKGPSSKVCQNFKNLSFV